VFYAKGKYGTLLSGGPVFFFQIGEGKHTLDPWLISMEMESGRGKRKHSVQFINLQAVMLGHRRTFISAEALFLFFAPFFPCTIPLCAITAF